MGDWGVGVRLKRRLPWLTPAGIAVFAAMAALAMGMSSVASGSPQIGTNNGVGNPTAGAQLFAQNCATCHGAQLQGGIGPALNPLTFGTLDYAYLTDHICNGFTQSISGYSAATMPHWCQSGISTQNIFNLAAFIIYQNQHVHAIKGVTANQLRVDLLFNAGFSTLGIGAMLVLVALLAGFNMRWIAARRRNHR